MTRYLIVTMALGQAILGLEDWLFGTTPGYASIDEIIKTWPQNKQRALELALGRAWKGMIAAGGLGIIANYTQHAMDIAERRGAKSPLEPPALGSVKGIAELAISFYEQGKLTARDLDEFLNFEISIYGKRYCGRMAGRQKGGAGVREERGYHA